MKIGKCVSFLAAILLLPGCLDIERSEVTIKYSASTGAGYYEQKISKISEEDKKAKANPKETKTGLEDTLAHMKEAFKACGLSSIKTYLKENRSNNSFDAKISGKFRSLDQLPVMQSYRFSFEDDEEKKGNKQRLDKVIEFSIKSNDLVSIAKNNKLTFISTDGNAPIVNCSPKCKINRAKNSITWSLSGEKDRVRSYKVRLKGVPFNSL